MHGYETKELRADHLQALTREKASAETRIAHAEAELERGEKGPQKAYLERVIERSTAEIEAVEGQLKAFSSKAQTKRARATKR